MLHKFLNLENHYLNSLKKMSKITFEKDAKKRHGRTYQDVGWSWADLDFGTYVKPKLKYFSSDCNHFTCKLCLGEIARENYTQRLIMPLHWYLKFFASFFASCKFHVQATKACLSQNSFEFSSFYLFFVWKRIYKCIHREKIWDATGKHSSKLFL